MNLRRAEKAIGKLFAKMGLDFVTEIEDDHLTAKNMMTMRGHDDNIFCVVDLYSNGNFGMEFVFDKIEPTPAILTLINNFNKSVVWHTAHIREDGFLVLRYNVMFMAQRDVVRNIRGFLEELGKERVNGLLRLITTFTTDDYLNQQEEDL